MQVFRDTRGTESRVWAQEQVDPGLRTPAGALTHPLSFLPFTGRPGKRRWEGKGAGRHRHPPKNLHNTTIFRRMARLAALTMKSMGNMTGL